MFATIRQIFNPKNKDIQKRILFTFIVLFVFRLGAAIVVPGIDKDSLGVGNLGFLELINVMGGGALEKFSIFSLGVTPYISATIVMQFLEKSKIPYFSELYNQGYTGRAKLNQITRMAGIAIALIQGFILSFTYIGNGTPFQYVEYALMLTAGTAFLLWLGDRITAKGVGNGISVIIMAGIISNIPIMFSTAFTSLTDFANVQTIFIGILSFIIFIVVYLAIVLGIIYIGSAERRIPIQYANKSTASSNQNFIPFKLNTANVMPVIFASVLYMIFGMLITLIKSDGLSLFYNKWINYNTVTGLGLYVVFIFLFSYLYTFKVFDIKELTERLQKNGGYIPAVRPGEETQIYIKSVLKKITFVGTSFLAIIAILPTIFGMITSLPTSVSVGGTGLIIVVGVVLEIYKQIEGTLLSRSYVKGRKR